MLSEAQVKAFSYIKSWGKLFLQRSDVLHSPFSGPPCGRPTEAACRAVTHSNSVPVGSERNNGRVWLMGERNNRQSLVSIPYYHTVCSVPILLLVVTTFYQKLAHSVSNQLPHPRPPVNIHFKNTHHTHRRIPMHKHERVSERKRDLQTEWKICLKAMNVYQVDQWLPVKSFGEL